METHQQNIQLDLFEPLVTFETEKVIAVCSRSAVVPLLRSLKMLRWVHALTVISLWLRNLQLRSHFFHNFAAILSVALQLAVLRKLCKAWRVETMGREWWNQVKPGETRWNQLKPGETRWNPGTNRFQPATMCGNTSFWPTRMIKFCANANGVCPKIEIWRSAMRFDNRIEI